MKFIATTFFAACMATTALSAPLQLSPANPQPSQSQLKSGLAVSYAFGGGGRTLKEAKSRLKNAEPGAPLPGLSFLEGSDGEPTLTTTKPHKVAAAISGYIQFEQAGTYTVDFWSNDGLEAMIGGQQVVFFDGIHGCESAGAVEVSVPQAGWYALEATYFQRKGGACLMMDWSMGGELEPVPDSAFAHVPG